MLRIVLKTLHPKTSEITDLYFPVSTHKVSWCKDKLWSFPHPSIIKVNFVPANPQIFEQVWKFSLFLLFETPTSKRWKLTFYVSVLRFNQTCIILLKLSKPPPSVSSSPPDELMDDDIVVVSNLCCSRILPSVEAVVVVSEGIVPKSSCGIRKRVI